MDCGDVVPSTMNMVKRKRTKVAGLKVMSRDNGLCGIHLGGCGQPITGKCEVDHIVPLGLAKLVAAAPRDFDSLCNYQPMHESCNRKKSDAVRGRRLEDLEKAVTVGANTPDDWPRFQCKCHYLQIFGGDLYVCTREPVGVGEHRLYTGVVKDFSQENRQDAILVVGGWAGSGGVSLVGFNRDGKNDRGYLFPSFSPRRVVGFNILQRGHVGLGVPKQVYVDEKGHVTPLL